MDGGGGIALSGPLRADAGVALLALARGAIEEALGLGRSPPPSDPALQEKRGAFVTLRGQVRALRGCIGLVAAREPLRDLVPDLARSAAFEDPRFEPLARHELAAITLEVSVLTTPEPLEDLARLDVGRHGLILVAPGAKALLLPQVATEHGFDRETFLSMACRKAGLPDDAWRSASHPLRWQTFEAQVFEEP